MSDQPVGIDFPINDSKVLEAKLIEENIEITKKIEKVDDHLDNASIFLTLIENHRNELASKLETNNATLATAKK